MELKDKIVVITGADKGLGKSLAQFFVKEGAHVVISSHSKDSLEKTAKEIGAVSFVADVTKEQEVLDLASKALEKFGVIDVWINNAGVMYSFPKDELINMEKAHNTFDVNFFGVLFGCRTAIKNMKAGIIMTINSSSGLDATRALDYKIYVASKWAIRGFLQAFKAQHSESKIKIISVFPGGIKTELYGSDKPDSFSQFMEPDYVSEKIISNLKLENPEIELVIKRPTA